MRKRVLVVEDDATLVRVLSDNLEFEGFEVCTAADGRTALALARSFGPDLVILDVMLPDASGLELCGLLRADRPTAVIMLTARSQKTDKVLGLTRGADDYVTKPFDMEELLARIHAVLRRFRSPAPTISLGDVQIDFRNLVARRGREVVRLSHREFDVLRFLAERAEQVVQRDELLLHVWGYPDLPETRSVDHAIARLRKKIEPDPHSPRFIHTVHGDGYLLTPGGRAPHLT